MGIHTYKYTQTHMYIHRTHILIHAQTHIHIQTQTRTDTYTQTHTHIYISHTGTRMHIYIGRYTDMGTHTYKHTHILTCTHIHIIYIHPSHIHTSTHTHTPFRDCPQDMGQDKCSKQQPMERKGWPRPRQDQQPTQLQARDAHRPAPPHPPCAPCAQDSRDKNPDKTLFPESRAHCHEQWSFSPTHMSSWRLGPLLKAEHSKSKSASPVARAHCPFLSRD